MPTGSLPISACRTRRAHAARRTLFLSVVLVLPAWPAMAAYKVELNAPAPVRAVLAAHLDLMRYRDRKDINDDQLNFMIDTVPSQVTKLTSTEGYFLPQTKVSEDVAEGVRTIRVTVDPGPRTVVQNTEIRLAGPAATQSPQQVEQLRLDWPLTRGAPFRQEDWAAAKQGGLAALQRLRYPLARVGDSQARIYPDLNQADLEVAYDSGPPFRLGPLRIAGVDRYPEAIVRNLNPLHEGEDYSADRLLEFQRQLQRMPYYSNVVIDIERDAALADAAPVNVRVTEYPTQRVRLGAGYATDTGAHLEARYSHYNVFGRGWVSDTQTRLEQKRQYLATELAMPPDAGGYVNSTHASIDRTTLEGVDLRSRRIGARRTRESDKRDFAYTLEYYSDQLQQLSGATLPPDTVVLPGTNRALVAGVALTRRQIDNPRFPRRGYIAAVEAGAALQGLLTDQTFFRTYGRLRDYLPVGKHDLVILRAEVGAVVSRGGNAEIPASLLFRAGGTESVRGYSYQSIGNVSNGTVYPTRFLVTGGAEYQRWFSDEWGAAVFYDVGTATDRWSGKAFYHAVGVGARWRSPIGPINADIGYGLKLHTFRPHLSLGIVF